MKTKSIHNPLRVFLDTNVVLDYLLEREPFYFDAQRIWAACEERLVIGCISALTVSTVHYVARKMKSETTAMIAVRGILDVFEIRPLDRDVLMRAVDSHKRDYEDDVQLQTAIGAGCTQLFTRNPRHFAGGDIAILAPSEFKYKTAYR